MRTYAFFASGLLTLSVLSCSATPPDNSGSGAAPGSGTTGATGATGTGGDAAATGSGGSTGTTGSGGTINVSTGAGGSISVGTGGSGGNSAMTCDGKLSAVIRDFTPAHLDFEVAMESTNTQFFAMYPARVPGKVYASDKGIVGPTLGPDSSPVYAANETTGSPTTTGKANFDQWFRDTPGVNQRIDYIMEFTDPDGDGVFSFDNGGMPFFPIDNQGLGNYPLYGTVTHNYHMTLELHSQFIYQPGMVFSFYGDDDVWVYINNTLVVDLGGVHGKETGEVALDGLQLTPGGAYQLDFFWAERHITESNFKIDTSITFIDCGIVIPR